METAVAIVAIVTSAATAGGFGRAGDDEPDMPVGVGDVAANGDAYARELDPLLNGCAGSHESRR